MPRRFATAQEKKTYQSWADMRCRCNNENHVRWDDYGGRGIKVCERWSSFEAFVEDMGLKPEGLSLERKDNGLGYDPGNCCWATVKAQNRNTRKNRLIGEDRRPLAEQAERMGISRNTLNSRINLRGWDPETALSVGLGTIINIPDDPQKRKYLPRVTDEQAAEIRRLFAAGGWSMRGLGREFGISGTSVHRILQNEVHRGR